MKVKELIALLNEEDQESEVIIGPDRDDWYYDVSYVDNTNQKIENGKMLDKTSRKNIVLINMD